MDQKEAFSQMKYIPLPEQYEDQRPFKLIITSQEQRFYKQNVGLHLENSQIKPLGFKVISKSQVHLFFQTMDNVIEFSPPILFANCELNLQSCQNIPSHQFIEQTKFKERQECLIMDENFIFQDIKDNREKTNGTTISLQKILEQDQYQKSTQLNSCYEIGLEKQNQHNQLQAQQKKVSHQIITSLASSILAINYLNFCQNDNTNASLFCQICYYNTYQQQMEVLKELDFLPDLNAPLKIFIYVLIFIHLAAFAFWCIVACPSIFKKSDNFSNQVEQMLKKKAKTH